MSDPVLHGPGYSTYVRTARIALAEKGVAYRLAEFDIMQGIPEAHLRRHPFGKVPAFEHDGFQLYETFAIGRYVDEYFNGPPLQPGDPRDRARMTQIVGIVDSYFYPAALGKIVMQRLIVPMQGGSPDEALIGETLPTVEQCFAVLEGFIGDRSALAGQVMSLADYHVAPVMAYLSQTPEGKTLLDGHPNLARWWETARHLESMAATEPKLG